MTLVNLIFCSFAQIILKECVLSSTHSVRTLRHYFARCTHIRNIFCSDKFNQKYCWVRICMSEEMQILLCNKLLCVWMVHVLVIFSELCFDRLYALCNSVRKSSPILMLKNAHRFLQNVAAMRNVNKRSIRNSTWAQDKQWNKLFVHGSYLK